MSDPRPGRAIARALAVGVLLSLRPAASLPVAAPALVSEPGRVVVAIAGQRVEFTRVRGEFVLTTAVWTGATWQPLFDAGRPLLDGPLFGGQPTSYTVRDDSPERKAVEFVGRHTQPDYDWTLVVEARAGLPLLRLVVTCRLRQPLRLTSPQPAAALWLRGAAALQVDQGPDSIYGRLGIPFGFGFPAAYLWDDGREAAVFCNGTPMRWLRADGVARFHDARVSARREGGATGLGLHVTRLSGPRLPAGDLVVELWLHQAARPARPSGLAALDTLVNAFAPLHPGASELPRNQLTGQPASWEQYAHAALADLCAPTACARLAAPWRDEPLALVPPQSELVVHPAHPMAAPANSWDFSTVNNHLTPWLLLAQLEGQTERWRLGLAKLDALPRFYDPRAGLYRHGTRQPAHVGDLEMSWQNLWFHQEALRAASAVGPSACNPAVAGRFLLATDGLRELAHASGYTFPQWFDPYTKQVRDQHDDPRLGQVREPWQAGSYAQLMLAAFELSGSDEYLQEARRAIDTLFAGPGFRVRNQAYDREYVDPAEYPVTELFGNASGVIAAWRLHALTGEARYLRYSRDCLNTLLRLTPWYEDETDAVSRELHSAGLFYPHGGAHVVTPWETAEAHLALAWTLGHDRTHPLTELLLKLSNLNRLNAFWFFPATWTPTVLALEPARQPGNGWYFPIEPFYCLEGTGGHRGPTAAYMASLALWNYWLYEALAQADDPRVLVLNLAALDGYDAALAGVERPFVIYNPAPTALDCRVRLRHLPAPAYRLELRGETLERSAAELAQGVPLTLGPAEHVRLTLRSLDHRDQQAALAAQRHTAAALAGSYARLQRRAAREPVPADELQAFQAALAAYRAGGATRP